MKAYDFIDRLKHLLLNRNTFYCNSFPGNCGEIHEYGILSFDCIGLVKSVINDPDIVYKASPVGYYVVPDQIIPDYSELQLLNLSDPVWNYFYNLIPGEYLYMEGHAGIYIGDLGNVNVIECTTAWGINGVVCSYIDPMTGGRYDQKGGTLCGVWEAHSKLTPFIDYCVGWEMINNEWYHTPNTGWYYDNAYNGWFLLDHNSKMLTGWQYVDNKWYYLQPYNDGEHVSGIMRIGWLYDPDYNGWFLLASSGEMLTGWQYVNNNWYYLSPEHTDRFATGQMVSGDVMIDGKTEHFNDNGAWDCTKPKGGV